jgi:transmembrane sensor
MNQRSSNSDLEATRDIDSVAAEWLARRYGGFSAEESAAFDAWVSANPRHASAVADIEKAWRVVSFPAAAGQGAIAQERSRVRERHRARRRRASLATLGMAAAALLVFAVLPSWRSGTESGSSRIVLRPDVQTLPDGSRAQLNLGAEIVPAFTAEKRLVKLVRGEALFTVTKDATRPFVVSAGGIEVKAVGTAFAVRYDPGHVDVLVTEGTVAINRSAMKAVPSEGVPLTAPPSDAVVLTAGHRTLVPLGSDVGPAVYQVTPAQISAALGWRERRVEFTSTPLAEAIELFNRHNDLQLAVADAKTGAFQISGIFWADHPESFVRLLETAFQMKIDRSGLHVTVRRN